MPLLASLPMDQTLADFAGYLVPNITTSVFGWLTNFADYIGWVFGMLALFTAIMFLVRWSRGA